MGRRGVERRERRVERGKVEKRRERRVKGR